MENANRLELEGRERVLLWVMGICGTGKGAPCLQGRDGELRGIGELRGSGELRGLGFGSGLSQGRAGGSPAPRASPQPVLCGCGCGH